MSGGVVGVGVFGVGDVGVGRGVDVLDHAGREPVRPFDRRRPSGHGLFGTHLPDPTLDDFCDRTHRRIFRCGLCGKSVGL